MLEHPPRPTHIGTYAHVICERTTGIMCGRIEQQEKRASEALLAVSRESNHSTESKTK